MKKMFACFLLLLITNPGVYADDEPGMQEAGNEPSADQTRGVDGAPKKTWDEAWRGFFGRDLPDPLADPEMSPEEWQRQREEAARHGQAAADFTQAATTIVTAGTPSPTTAAGAATLAIGEAAQATVDAQTTAPAPPPAQPSAWQRFVNWVGSWFE